MTQGADGYSITFKIPSVPPSVNSLYNVIFSLKKVEKKPEVRLWQSQAKEFIPVWRPEKLPDTPWLYMKIKVGTNLWYKNGQARKLDMPNMEKALIDTVCEKIGLDDKYVIRKETEKFHSEIDFTEVEIGFAVERNYSSVGT